MREINIAGFVIILVFTVFVGRKKEKLLTDYLLLFLNGLFLLLFSTGTKVLEYDNRLIHIIHTLIPFYIPPAYFLYVSNLMRAKQKLINRQLWFSALALVFTIYIISDLFIINPHQDLKSLLNEPPLTYLMFFKANSLLFIGVLIWLIRKLSAYSGFLKSNFSNANKLDLSWVKYLSYIFLLNLVTSSVVFLLFNFNIIKEVEWVYIIFDSTLVAGFFIFCYKGINRYVIAQIKNKQIDSVELSESSDKQLKYQSSSLTAEELNDIFEAFNNLVREQKLYLNHELSIHQVAQQLDISVHALSQSINTITEKPFYDIINQYRIDHFKTLVENDDNNRFTILALAYDSGFNSKASFYRVFKLMIGMTPTAYRKSMKSQLQLVNSHA